MRSFIAKSRKKENKLFSSFLLVIRHVIFTTRLPILQSVVQQSPLLQFTICQMLLLLLSKSFFVCREGTSRAMASACFLGCRSPNGEEDEAEEKCDNCDIIACSKECMKLHKPTDHPSMLSLVQKVYEVVNLVPILVLHQLYQ